MEKKKYLSLAFYLLTAFVIWTIAVSFVDVKEIGPNGSAVGLSGINGFVHEFTGVNMDLYVITDWLGLVPISIASGFGVLGFVQFVKRKSIIKVDKNIIVLGLFYVAVLAAFVFFENFIVNYRPVLIDGTLEASYPSSTTMLTVFVMTTALLQFDERIKNDFIKKIVKVLIVVFIAFMVLGRTFSGVHWISDIIGGVLLSFGLVCLYYYFTK